MRYKKMRSRYSHLILPDSFTFPTVMTDEMTFISKELEFTALIVLNEWLQTLLGIEDVDFTPEFPDIHAKVKYFGDDIRIELEYEAINYKLHKHPWGACHIIVSFVRAEKHRVVSGVPVWSFYKRVDDRLVWCLNEDMEYAARCEREGGDEDEE